LFFISDSLPGVAQKISHTISALSDLGYVASETPISGGFWFKRFKMFERLLSVRADVILIRYEYLTAFLYLPLFMYYRFMGRQIVFDVPTPLSAAAREVLASNSGLGVRLVKLLLLYAQGPFVMSVGSLVLQYAPESRFFSLGITNKIMYVSNGIDSRKFEGFQSLPKVSGCLRFVCVGAIASWHGVDRLIRGIANYNRSRVEDVSVTLSVVGQGAEVAGLTGLVDELGLQDAVRFLGQLTGDDLLEVYRRSDVGVGTLGLHRKGLSDASPLKNREYCSIGLPLLLSHDDPDFNGVNFCMRIDSSDSPVDVASVVRWYVALEESGVTAEDIKSFARERLDYRGKWQRIFEALA